MISSKYFICSTVILLSGCVAQGAVPQSSTRPNISTNIPVVNTPSALDTKGLESVLGLTAAQLERNFGKARLDVREVNGRKLQFRGDSCIMDVYLYPDGSKKIEVATHVDARRSNGAVVDRVECVQALLR